MGAKVVSVISMKGGVGKSSLLQALIYQIAVENQKRVLVIDADKQGSLSKFLGLSSEDMKSHEHSNPITGLYNNTFNMRGFIKSEDFDTFVLFPSHRSTLKNAIDMHSDEENITSFQKLVDYHKDDFDFILIDTPGEVDKTSAMCLGISHCFIYAMEPVPAADDTVEESLGEYNKFLERFDTPMKKMIAIPTKYKKMHRIDNIYKKNIERHFADYFHSYKNLKDIDVIINPPFPMKDSIVKAQKDALFPQEIISRGDDRDVIYSLETLVKNLLEV